MNTNPSTGRLPDDRTVRLGTDNSRLVDVDALRGFSLAGILIVNITFFASGYPAQGVADPHFSTWLDHSVHWVIALLFETKFYLLFSFLFGYSFTLQIDSAVRRRVAFAPRFLRRLAGLFLLGAAHALFLFHGDILTTYALLGLVLLAMHRIRPRTAVIAAGVVIGVVALLAAVAGVVSLASGDVLFDPVSATAEGARATAALRGGPGSIIGQHLHDLPLAVLGLSVQAPMSLAAFLVGLAAGKLRLLADVSRHAGALRTIQWVGYPVGLAGAVVFASLGGTSDLLVLAVDLVTAPLLAAAYAATVLRVFHDRNGHRVTAVLAPAGRMALTNYLGQSVLFSLIFTGYGLGLIGEIPPFAVLLLAVIIFANQAVASRWWLDRYRYGPVEWLLRAVTTMAWPAWSRQKSRG